MANKKLKEAAMKEVMEGIKLGTIKVEVIFKCGWCLKSFKSEKAYEDHLVTGKTMDPETEKLRRICPN
jgi:uncharacterized C2H2 Zn-finger protein